MATDWGCGSRASPTRADRGRPHRAAPAAAGALQGSGLRSADEAAGGTGPRSPEEEEGAAPPGATAPRPARTGARVRSTSRPPQPTSTDFGPRVRAPHGRGPGACQRMGGGDDDDDDEEEAPLPQRRAQAQARALSMHTCPACPKVHNRRRRALAVAPLKKTDAHWSGGGGGRRRRHRSAALRTAPTAPPAASHLPCRRPRHWLRHGTAGGLPAASGRRTRTRRCGASTRSTARPRPSDRIKAGIGTQRTASAAEHRWLLIKNKSTPAPAAAEPPAKKRKKSEKRVEKKKKKQRSRVWDLDKKKYVTS